MFAILWHQNYEVRQPKLNKQNKTKNSKTNFTPLYILMRPASIINFLHKIENAEYVYAKGQNTFYSFIDLFIGWLSTFNCDHCCKWDIRETNNLETIYLWWAKKIWLFPESYGDASHTLLFLMFINSFGYIWSGF